MDIHNGLDIEVYYYYYYYYYYHYHYHHHHHHYTVPKKVWSRTLAITLSNLNRFQTFLHCCKEKEISNKPCVIIPPHLRYVATLLCEIQQFKTDTNYTQNTIKCPHV